jgi:phosphatidylglycerophosphate synthase
MSAADCLSSLRVLLVVLIWPLVLAGHGRLAGIGLVAAGVTDYLDGYVARRVGRTTARGAWLDAIADLVLLVSAAAWLVILFPTVLTDNGALLAATAVLYAVGIVVSGRLADPGQFSSKIAGGMLYGFAVFTFIAGVYVPVLLRLAALALAVSSVESIVRKTIQLKGRTSRARSHAPQALNDVVVSASPTTSIPSSATPTPNEIRP